MYTKMQPDGSAEQSYRRGSPQIPASYGGTAFSAEFPRAEIPHEELPRAELPRAETTAEAPAAEPVEVCKTDSEPSASCGEAASAAGLGGLLADDLLLIGLILLLSRERESSTGTLLLLALLLLG